MMFDSDVLIWYTRRDENAGAWINSAPDRATSVVCVMEVLQGCRSKAEMSGIHATLHGLGFKILPLSESIGEKALTLIQEHAHADGLHLTDALIASTAIEAGEASEGRAWRHPVEEHAAKRTLALASNGDGALPNLLRSARTLWAAAGDPPCTAEKLKLVRSMV